VAEVKPPDSFGPFCSERCRAADLGKWLDGGYRISSPVAEEDLDQGVGQGEVDSDSDGDTDSERKLS
jgi:endogenous inhibitor of DNA gyrase (YacG/DUF329 family)